MSDAEAEAEDEAEAQGEDETFDPEHLADLVGQVGEYVTEIKRAIVDDEDGGNIVELAEDLWEVLQELEELLETLDFEELPDAIDIEELPEAVDVEDIPEGLFDEDESAIDLGDVTEAVNLRELWDAVDLTQFLKEKRELEAAVDDVADGGDDDGEDDGMFENVVDMDGADVSFEQSARQEFIEEKIMAAVEKFRSALLSTHDGLRKIYRENQKKLGQEGNQPDSLNPTARSTMPAGPLPDSISTRTSTVPSQVKYSRADNPRRIFGRRFKERHDDEDSRTTSADADAEESTDADAEGADTSGAAADAEAEPDEDGDTDDESGDAPEIEVFEEDE